MAEGGRYSSAMFWLAFGTAAAVIGLALMTIGVARSQSDANLLASPWFDSGAGLLGVGALLLLWALVLYMARRRDEEPGRRKPTTGSDAASGNAEAEAVRGYYAERDKLFDLWERQQKSAKPKKK